MLDKEYNYFKKHASQFLKKHLGEFIVIKKEQIIGFFPTEHEAFEYMKNDELGTFFVKECSLDSLKSQKFHSRVVISR